MWLTVNFPQEFYVFMIPIIMVPYGFYPAIVGNSSGCDLMTILNIHCQVINDHSIIS